SVARSSASPTASLTTAACTTPTLTTKPLRGRTRSVSDGVDVEKPTPSLTLRVRQDCLPPQSVPPRPESLEEPPARLHFRPVSQPESLHRGVRHARHHLAGIVAHNQPVQVDRVDRLFVYQPAQQVQQRTPVVRAHECDGEVLHLAGLDERRDL